MTVALADESCEATRKGMVRLAETAIRALLRQVPEWSLTGEGKRLERGFRFKNFAEALAFINALGTVAEQQNHHPDIAFGWGYARIAFTTHDAGGLTRNDLVMAAKTDRLAR
jgi:4a-hydroxytetrahydrobiopterin dehydratase